jgi:outer membrane protein TolC
MRSVLIAAALTLAAQTAAAAPLTLQDAYRQALANNPQMKAAREQVKQAEIQAGKAWTYLGPTLNAQLSHSWNNEVSVDFPYTDPRTPGYLIKPNLDASCPVPPDPSSFGRSVSTGAVCFLQQPKMNKIIVRPSESTTLALQGSQPIFSGQTLPGVQMAYAGEDATRYGVAAAQEQILFGVATAYYGVATAERYARLSDQSLANLRDHLKTAETRFAVGQIPRMGVLQAQIEVTKAEAAAARARNDYQNARLALGNLIGASQPPELPSAEDLTAATFKSDFPADPTAEANQNRGDLKSSEAQLHVAQHNRTFNLMSLSPVLMLNGNLQHTDQPGSFGEKDSWTLMLMLNVPILQGGARIFNVRDGYSKLRQAESTLEAKRAEVRLDVQTAVSKLEVTRQNVAVAAKTRELAQENYTITKVSFENGLATSLDMIDANQALLGAELNFTREQFNLRLDTLNLYRAMGTLTPALGVAAEEE